VNQPFDTRVLEDAGRRTAPTGCARASTAGRSMARPSYEAQLEAGCERFRACRYDGGAFGRVVDKPEYITADLHHFSIQGGGSRLGSHETRRSGASVADASRESGPLIV
jgi:hypothetical protein